jgi:hypothetical protein
MNRCGMIKPKKKSSAQKAREAAREAIERLSKQLADVDRRLALIELLLLSRNGRPNIEFR